VTLDALLCLPGTEDDARACCGGLSWLGHVAPRRADYVNPRVERREPEPSDLACFVSVLERLRAFANISPIS